jgi:Met-zincin/Domain of unknown function (DUF5117)/Domain of unknown function (DUF5118)
VALIRPLSLVVLMASGLPLAVGAQDSKDAPWKSYSEVTRGSEVGSGIFTVYYKRDHIYLSLSRSQLDRDYLLVTQISRGIGELGLDGGASLRSDLIRFHRENDQVELWVVNPHFAAAPGSPMARTVSYSFGHSVAQSFPIATVRDTSEILIDIAPFLLSDWADVGGVLQNAVNQRKLSATVSFDDKRSSLQELHLFPGNLEADVRLTFQAPRALALETISDQRWIPIGIHYSLLELPAAPMRPRLADDRVGYFISAIKDFSRDTAESFFVRYINRWRLEKKDPTAAMSEPMRPITFYVDHTVPLEWRPYVRAGILEWNKAFEQAGYRNAIQALDAPDDSAWSAADARYSTVRWTATNRSVYAIGPATVDPRTGEILNADILVSAAWIQTWRGESGEYVTPMAAVRSISLEDSLAAEGGNALRCSFGQGLAGQGTLVNALFATRATGAERDELVRDYIGEALKALVMHEVGHTLGLRHNFRGSAGASADQLADRRFTTEHGMGVSVMDYSPPALALDPQRQGHYYAPTVGSYDRWAVTYGYAEVPVYSAERGRAPFRPSVPGGGNPPAAWIPEDELSGLRAIASEAADPAHLYGTDEDAGFGGNGLDPTVSRYDQTDDPLRWARERVQLIDGLFDSLETRVVAPGQGYNRLRKAFTDLLTDRWYALLVTTKYLGGATTARDHRGDPWARPAVTTVPAERQREALALISESAFGEQAYRFRPELLSRLGADRWMHWGTAPSAGGRIDFPLHDWALTQQSSLLGQLLDPTVLSRIRDAELRAAEGEPTLGIPELFDSLTAAIWAETVPIRPAGGKVVPVRNIGSVRRDLQRLHLNSLIRMVVSPAPGTPEDARTLARATMVNLAAQLDRALAAQKSGLDAYTRAHLQDSRERIVQALNAQVVQTTSMGR